VAIRKGDMAAHAEAWRLADDAIAAIGSLQLKLCKRCVKPICRDAFWAGMTRACENGIRQKIEIG
jgi:hypothetical protein